MHTHFSQQSNETRQKAKDIYHRELNAWEWLQICMHETNRINLKLWNHHPAKSGVDLHEPLQCSSNDHSLQQPRETCHYCAFSHYIQVEILCWFGGWPLMIPIQARVRNFEPPVRQKVAPKTHNTTQFRPTIQPNHRRFLSNVSVDTCRPDGSLPIVDLA